VDEGKGVDGCRCGRDKQRLTCAAEEVYAAPRF
jgi:hypothetical protein